MKIVYARPQGIRALWRHKPFMNLVILEAAVCRRGTLPHRQAVVELMQRTRRLMDGTAEDRPVFSRPVLYPKLQKMWKKMLSRQQ